MIVAQLNDLSFLRFPELTPGVLQSIMLLFLLLALTVLATVVVQRIVLQQGERRRERARVEQRVAHASGGERGMHLLGELAAYVEERYPEQLAGDPARYEEAVERMLAREPQRAPELRTLRRGLRMNVMNPDVPVLSTRQMLEELPVRIVASMGEERLDLYCTLLSVDEQRLLIQLPFEEDIHTVLTRQPQVNLLYWREREGETVFNLTLEPVEVGHMAVYRAAHGFRDETAGQRAAYRLTVDWPVFYRYLAPEQLRSAREQGAKRPRPVEGNGRMVDVGYGGAAFSAPQAMQVGGLVQVQCTLSDKPFHAMLAVHTCAPQEGGRYLVRGAWRGMQDDMRALLSGTLQREQLKRLRQKELIHRRPDQG